MSIKSALSSIANRIDAALMGISFISLLSIIALIIAEVVLRRSIDYSIPAMIGIIEDYLLIAMVFSAMSYIYKEGGHIKVSLFERFIPSPVKRPVDAVVKILGIAYFSAMMVFNCQATFRAIRLKEMSSDVIGYPLAVGYFFITIGCALLCIRIINSIFYPVGEDNVESSHF